MKVEVLTKLGNSLRIIVIYFSTLPPHEEKQEKDI